MTKAQRFRRFIEGIEIVKKLWTEDRVSFAGRELRGRPAYVITKIRLDVNPAAVIHID